MKALLSHSPGGPETLVLSDVPAPTPGPGELGVRVLACAINYPDVLVIEDRYQSRPPRPFAPGFEISAVVETIGAAVSGWAPGDRLIAVVPHGGLAEKAVVTAESAIRIAADRDPVEAAAMIFTYGTTQHALIDRAALKAGETLLVLGAAGGVGLSAVEVGKALGATVVAAVSSEEKALAAIKAGADRTIVYGRASLDTQGSRSLAQQFKTAVGNGGANVIFDPVGGDYCEPALRSIAWEGRYLVVGFPAGIPRLPLNLALLKSCDVKGVFWGGFVEREPAHHQKNVQQLLEWWGAGRIRPRIDRTYTLADGAAAISRLASRSAIGKVVVDMT